jgi:hypothetical protein
MTTTITDWVLQNPAIAWPIISSLIVVTLKPRTPEAYAAMSAIRPTWFFARLAALLQLIGALGLDPVKALQVVSKVFTGKQNDGSKIVGFITFGFVFFYATACGMAPPSPHQVKDGVQTACTLLSALHPDATQEAICATVPELAEIATNVLESRNVDSGVRRLEYTCQEIPNTRVCATNSERLAAILAVRAGRVK